MDRQQQLLSWVENIAKTAAAFIAISTALGVPAVYMRMNDLNIPSHLISYEQAIYAGTAPAILFIAFGLYIYWIQEGPNTDDKNTTKRFFWGIIAPLGFVGMVSALLIGTIWFWGTL